MTRSMHGGPHRVRIGIIGAGRGGSALLSVLKSVPEVEVAGICDIDPDAPGLGLARQRGVPVFPNADTLVQKKALDWLINVSHESLEQRTLLSDSLNDVRVIDGEVAEYLWKILTSFAAAMGPATPLFECSSAQTRALHALAWKIVEEVAEIAQGYHARLSEMAFHDSLTGLFTRGLLEEALAKEVSNALRHARALALLMVDIDHFKPINDQYGHPAGDAILQKTAALLEEVSRTGDLVARIGGEEFVVVLIDTPTAAAHSFAERLRTTIAARIRRPDGHALTVSVGVAALDFAAAESDRELRTSGKPSEQLLKIADEALYQAKSAGRNRVEMITISPGATGAHSSPA